MEGVRECQVRHGGCKGSQVRHGDVRECQVRSGGCKGMPGKKWRVYRNAR